jgi:hypothetical protein
VERIVQTGNIVKGDDRAGSTKDFVSVAKAINKLFSHWKLTDEQRCQLLGFDTVDPLRVFEKTPSKIFINEALKIRLSLLLNIHNGLRKTFKNPDNVYGYMSYLNNNAPYDGTTPISLACRDVHGLRKVSEAVGALGRGVW